MAGPSSQITKGFTLHKHFYGATPILSAEANATMANGDIVEEASGLLTLADHDDIATLVGVLQSAATAGAVVPYIPAWPGIIFEATLDGDTNTGIALAKAQLFQQYGLGIDAGNGKPYVNQEDTTNTVLTVVGFAPDATVGSTYQRVLVVFMSNKTVWGA